MLPPCVFHKAGVSYGKYVTHYESFQPLSNLFIVS